MMKRHRPKKHIRLKPGAWLLILLPILILIFCEIRLPSISENMVYDGAAKRFERMVNEEIMTLSDEYNFLSYQYNADGSIAAVTLSSDEANRFKASLLKNLEEKLTGHETLWIPLGNFTNIGLINGLGVKIPVNIHFTGTTSAEFVDEVVTSGINQSQYSLYIDISALMHTNSVQYKDEVHLNTRYVLAQTMIVGDVPQIPYSLSKSAK